MISQFLTVNRSTDVTACMANRLAQPQWRLVMVGLLCLVMVALSFDAQARQARIKKGAVMARAVVLDEQQKPILVRFDSQDGSELGVVQTDVDVEQVDIIAGSAIYQQKQQLESFRASQQGARARLMTRAQFDAEDFLAADNSSSIPKPDLDESIKSVLVLAQSDRYVSNADNLVIGKFHYNLESAASVSHQTNSALVDFDGNVVYASNDRIGYRVAFFGEDGSYQQSDRYHRKNEDVIYGPMRNAVPYIAGFDGSDYGGGSPVNSEGKYAFSFLLPQCPLGGFEFTTDVWAKVYYTSYLPTGWRQRFYALRTLGYDYCFAGLKPGPFGFTASYEEVEPNSIPLINSDLYVDVVFVNGVIQLKNQAGNTVELSEEDTVYSFPEQPLEHVLQNHYDFNQDGVADTPFFGKLVDKLDSEGNVVNNPISGEPVKEFVQLSNGADATHQGVYFTAPEFTNEPNAAAIPQPDVLRLIDTKMNRSPVGVLTKISQAAYKNTDVMLFRRSSGELILHRQGFPDEELDIRRASDFDPDLERVAYSIMLRGPRDSNLNIGGGVNRRLSYDAWAAQYKMAEPLQSKDADHLKLGEMITVVAINRTTGYLGSADVQLELVGGGVGVKVPDIAMTPPNLKVWAERDYTVAKGITAGEARHYTIGQEGASLLQGSGDSNNSVNSDRVTIYTEWLDSQGRPLPEGLGLNDGKLYGLTGRLAKVVDGRLVAASGAGNVFARFPIGPGRKTQALQIDSNLSTAEHYYVQVIAQPMNLECHAGDACANFDNERDDGRLVNTTPFLVPLFDEDKHWQQYNEYRQVLAEYQPDDGSGGAGNSATRPNKPLPAYAWQYRPEYQFSQYQLLVNQIEQHSRDVYGTLIEKDILNFSQPVLTSGDDLLAFVYSLVGSEGNLLPSPDSREGPKNLVLAVGEDEFELVLGDEQTLSITNLESLAGLSPEDYLSLRLYTNADAGNILWEYAFEYIWLESMYAGFDNASDDVFYVSADEPELPLQAVLVGYANRSPERKEPIQFIWSVTGDGVLDTTSQRDEDKGIFDNAVTLPPVTGASARVSVVMSTATDSPATLPRLEVVPGRVAEITVEYQGEISVGRLGEVDLVYTIKDQHGNLVADGTGVNVILDDSLVLVDHDEETRNGVVTAKVKGASIAGGAKVTLESDGVSLVTDLTVNPLNIELDSPLDNAVAGEKISRTIRVSDSQGNPASDVEISVFAENAYLAQSNLVTNANGEAAVDITIPNIAGQGQLSVTAGFQYQALASFAINYSNPDQHNLETQSASMVGDQSTDGMVEYTRYDQTQIAVPYNTSAEIEVIGTQGDTIEVRLGDVHDPNLPALVASGQIYNGILYDRVGRLPLETNNVEAVHQSMMGAGKSLRFEASQSSLLSSSDVSRLSLSRNLGVNFEIKVDSFSDANLVNLRHGLFALRLDELGILTFEVETTEGRYSVSSAAPLDTQWHKVAARYTAGQIELWLDGQVYAAPVQGDIGRSGGNSSNDEASAELEIGEGFNGLLNRLKWFDWEAQPLVSFDNGEQVLSATIANQAGRQVLTVKSLGNLNANYSQLDIQRVAVVTNNVRQYINLVSEQTFTRLASMYIDTVSPNAPPINLASLQPGYQPAVLPLSGVIAQAHASEIVDFGMGFLNFLLPIEDAVILVDQIGKLLFGAPGEFELSEFIISSINILTFLPPGRPLGPFVKPSSRFIRAMDAVNPKFLAATGGIFKRVLQRARRLDFDLALQLIPFVVIAAEIYADDDAREGLITMVKAISSTNDAISWIDYLTLPSNGWEGSVPPVVSAFGGGGQAQSLPLNFLFPQAIASNRRPDGPRLDLSVMRGLFNGIKSNVRRNGTKKDLDDLNAGIKSTTDAIKASNDPAVRKLAHKSYFLQVAVGAARRGVTNSFQVMLKGDKYTRLSTPAILAISAYLEYESQCGRFLSDKIRVNRETQDKTQEEIASDAVLAGELQCNDIGFKDAYTRSVIYRKWAEVFYDGSNKKLTEERDKDVNTEEQQDETNTAADIAKKIAGRTAAGHGALFHLQELAKYQLLSRSGTGMKVKATEAFRVVAFFDDAEDKNDAVREGLSNQLKRFRWVDIVLEDESQKEHWIELKSLAAKANNTKEVYASNFDSWEIRGHRQDRDAKGSGYHRQFTLDRAAASQEVAWLGLNPETNEYDRPVNIAGFTWLFQKFKRTYNNKTERSPVVGRVSESGSIAFLQAKDATVAKAVSKEVLADGIYALEKKARDGNFDMSGFDQLKEILIRKGFDVAANADDITAGLD